MQHESTLRKTVDGGVSALEFADELETKAVEAGGRDVSEQQKELGLATFTDAVRPKARLNQLTCLAEVDTGATLEVIDKHSEHVKKKSRKSGSSTASGLRLWHAFAAQAGPAVPVFETAILPNQSRKSMPWLVSTQTFAAAAVWW